MRKTDPIVLPNGRLPSRFWDKVEKSHPNECWLWTAGLNTKGYGKFMLSGRSLMAHRLAWVEANGRDFPPGSFACHACDNPKCVNPAHIWPGTNKDNLRDSAQKRRHHLARRSACKNGHPYTPENTGVGRSKGGATFRRCRICSRRNAHNIGKTS